MKRKLLLAATFVASALGMRAQTDVTSTYLTNADFEGEYTVYSYPREDGNDKRAIYQPNGWTITYTNGNSNDITALNSDCLQWNNFSGKSQVEGGGNNTYWIRYRWGNSESLVLSQTATLPAGKYCFSADAFFNGASGGAAKISAANSNKNVSGNNTWSNYEIEFTLTSETSVTFSFSLTQGSTIENIAGFDNFKLTYTAIVVKDVLETALTAATNANATLSNSDLTTAIATAQAVYDDEDATQDEVNAAAATLNAATELAMSAVGDVTGMFLANPGFESCTAETSDVAAKTPIDYSSAGWTNASTGSFTTIAVTAYGGGVKVGNSTTPSTKKDGTTVSGNTLGIIAGWGDNVTIQSNDVTLPAGVYTFIVDHYLTSTTNNYDNTSSKFGFVTSGSSYLVSNTTFSASTWTTETVTFTLTESTTGKIQIGLTGLDTSGSGSPAVFYDDITITYKSFLAGAKEAWDEAVDAANAAITANPNVTGEELTALNEELAKAEPTTVDGYNEATEALEAATATFTAAKAAYDVYAEIRGVAVALGVTPGDAPANAAAAPAATHALNVAVYNATTAENIFDVTEVYAPSWSSMSTSSGQHWNGDTSLSYADEWRGDANPTTRTATITLPAGSYILMSAGRGSSNTVPTMSANGTTVTFASNGDMGIGINKLGAASFDSEDAAGFANKSGEAENTGTGWEWRYIPVTLAEETAVTVTQTLTRLSGSAWGSFSDFRIMKVGVVATDDDYTALNSAISTAEAKTLGFEDGEYAPYNNVAALTALATAKAIDPNEANDQEVVQAVTTALTGATWTANDGDVDIIYNGHFAEANGTNPKGWTRSNGAWGQQITGLEASTGAETSTAWYYNTEGAWEYGKDGVYKMPLAAGQTYKLTFKYRSHAWGSNNCMKASVLNDSDEGLADVTYAQNINNVNFVTAIAYFTTGAAGNYILSLTQSGNTHLTDVSLVKVASAAIEISENANTDVSNETYADVTLTRTIKADVWNTFVVPFDLSNEELVAAFGETVAVAEYSETSADAENVTVSFTTMDTPAITANTPVLLKGAAGTSFGFSGKLIKTGEAKVEGNYIDFVGTYAATTDIAEGDYFIASDKLYKSAGSTTIAGTRAYLNVKDKENGAKVRMIIDDEATGIEGIAADAVQNGKVYDLSGRLVKNPTKGLYIQNGKKYFVK